MRLISIVLCFLSSLSWAQVIHAHNDYEQPIPFWQAYHAGAGSIEVDVWATNGQVWVAHDSTAFTRTWLELYGNPIQQLAAQNKIRPFQLVIDLKSTWSRVWPLQKPWFEQNAHVLYPQGPVQLVFSGAMPDPSLWSNLPAYIFFDGRPQKEYSRESWDRIAMVSDYFGRYVRWNGKGIPTERECATLEKVIRDVHQKQRPIRFWAIPDDITSWMYLSDLGVDFLNTDRVEEVKKYLADRPKSKGQIGQAYPVYQPKGNIQSAPLTRVILMIGDGMGLAQISALHLANQGNSHLANMPIVGLSNTRAADSEVTDSAAGATAMASGKKANNRAIGWIDGKPATERLTEIAKSKKWKTGILTLGDWTDATPAAFYASQPDRSFQDAIASDFLKNSTDLLIGSGEDRVKRLHLVDSLQAMGFHFSLTSLPSFFVQDSLGLSNVNGRIPLRNWLDTCFQVLTPHSFFLVVEGAQIDYGGHANDLPYIVAEMADFDQGVGRALAFVDENPGTLLVVTADHETGGLTILGGNQARGEVEGHFSTHDHSGSWVPVFAYGTGAELFGGVYSNSEIFHKIKMLIKKD